MSAIHWEKIGIPEGYAYPDLYFNPPSNKIIASLADKASQIYRKLFVRSATDEVYLPLTSFSDEISVNSIVVSATEPYALFTSQRWGLHQGIKGEYLGGEWHGFTYCNLDSLVLTDYASPGTLVFPAPFTSGWLCDVLQVEDSSETSIVRACAYLPDDHKAHYFVGRFYVSTRRLTIISFLADPFL